MLRYLPNVEFFAVLPAGTYATVALVLLGRAGSASDGTAGLWSTIKPLALEVQGTPALLLALLGAAYLLGSMIRILPVRWVESLVPPFQPIYPHVDRLAELLDNLRKAGPAVKLDRGKAPELKADSDIHGDVLNYWKNCLCIQAPDGFRYYQSFEARSRFFAGMFWAGFLSSLASLAAYAATREFLYVAQVFAPSALVTVLFGRHFHRVRRQEAKVLLSLYCVIKGEPKGLAH